MTDLEKAKDLLRRIKDVIAFDQFPEEQQCHEISMIRAEVVEFLNEPDDWTEAWKKLEKAQEDFHK